MSKLLSLFGLPLLCAPAAAQNVYMFDINMSASNFTWTGNSDLGRVDPSPTNMFDIFGPVEIRLTPGADPISEGQFLSGAIQLSPEFAGVVPSLPSLPPLAMIQVNGQVLTIESAPFPIASDGSFSVSATLSNTAGDVCVTAFGNTFPSSLVGTPPAATPISGTFTLGAGDINVAGPLTATFTFTDPGTGVSGSFTITGTIDANHTGIYSPTWCNGDGGDQMGCSDCPCANNAPLGTIGGCLNSATTAMRMRMSGTTSIVAGDLRIEASGAPPSNSCQLTSGNALAPGNAANPCFGLNSGITSTSLDGLRCVVQGVLRHGVRPSDANGDVGVTTNGWGSPNGFFNFAAFVDGQTKHFQIINRDDAAQICLTGQNTSQAQSITFTP